MLEKDFIKEIYSFSDIPNKRKHVLERTKKIYLGISGDIIEKILDSVKIIFRKQDEKGASNHIKKIIYVTLNEIDRYNIKNRNDFIKYLEDPKSVVTHEVTHIFQNIFNVFPDVKYVYKDENNKWQIDYTKYRTDKGEIQSRVEQIIEMLKWGFDDEEIIDFLYSRKYKDKDLWRIMLECAGNIKKEGSSKLPGIDNNEDITNENGKFKNDYQNKDTGTNYDRDYLSGGSLSWKDK